MTERSFAMLAIDDAHRLVRKGLALEARHLRLVLELSPLTSFEGLFYYPLEIAARETGLSPSGAHLAMTELVNAGEVEYDFDENWCRVIGWHDGANRPNNPDMALKRIRKLFASRCPNVEMRLRALFECTFAILNFSRHWKNAGSIEGRLHSEISGDLQALRDDNPEIYDRIAGGALQLQPDSIRTLAIAAHIVPRDIGHDGGHGVDTEEEEKRRATENQTKEIEKKESVTESLETTIACLPASRGSAEKMRAARPTEATKRSALGSKK